MEVSVIWYGLVAAFYRHENRADSDRVGQSCFSVEVKALNVPLSVVSGVVDNVPADQKVQKE